VGDTEEEGEVEKHPSYQCGGASGHSSVVVTLVCVCVFGCCDGDDELLFRESEPLLLPLLLLLLLLRVVAAVVVVARQRHGRGRGGRGGDKGQGPGGKGREYEVVRGRLRRLLGAHTPAPGV
jgi:hypothetical protein